MHQLQAKDYDRWLDELKMLVKSARISVARSVSRGQNALYWEIGERILATQAELGWGEAVVDRISNDLKTSFPGVTGFSSRNLRDMKRLVSTYSDEAMWRQIVATLQSDEPSSAKWRQLVAKFDDGVEATIRALVLEVPWGQNLAILNKVKVPEARLFYLLATVEVGWTRSVLLNQIKANAFERSREAGKQHNFSGALPEALAAQAEDTLKGSYDFGFLGIENVALERESWRNACSTGYVISY